jgi:hypothetical protein
MRNFGWLLLFCACGGPAAPGGGGEGSGHAPVILDLSSNVSTLSLGDSVSITAVVTHPDGIDQVVGGKLADPNGGTYGAFGVSTEAGAWTLTLAWNDMVRVKPLADADSGSENRAFVATFYDQAGHTTVGELDIPIHCFQKFGICGGQCAPLTRPEHCGSCANVCKLSRELGGGEDLCLSGGRCAFRDAYVPSEPCRVICGGWGLDCVEGATKGDYQYHSIAVSCDTLPAPTDQGEDLVALECECS